MKTIELTAVLENLDKCLDFIVQGVEEAGLDRKTASKLRLACEEIIVNVIHYAYPNQQGSLSVSYEFAEDKTELSIMVMDSGVSFNPLEKDEPDIDLPLEERQIGGLGIFMVRNIMDVLTYERVDGKNVLTMKKTLSKE